MQYDIRCILRSCTQQQSKSIFNVCSIYLRTLSLKSLYWHSSACYKTILNTGDVGRAPTSKLRTFLSRPGMLIYSNFQINGTSGETLKPPDPYFASKLWGLEVSEFLPRLHLFRNCYKSAYLEPRTKVKMSPIQKQEGKPQPRPHRLQFGQFYSIQIEAGKDFLETVYGQKNE